MTGPLAETLIAVLAATASLSVFAVIGRRTLAALPAAGSASDAGRP